MVSAGSARASDGHRTYSIGFWPVGVMRLYRYYQRGPNSIRDASAAKKVIEILEDHGWLIRIPGGTIVSGVRRRDVWKIVRE
jgi:hypothetical protein